MEGAAEGDLELQRASADLIAEFHRSISPFLRKSAPGKDGLPGQGRVRRLVRQSKTDQLSKILDQFQELPQLLDRHLSYFVQTLSSAFLEYLEHHGDRYHLPPNVAPSQHLTPLPRAVCKILYTLCKVRGHKVVAQLLGNEAKHLEPMLRAFCRWSQLPETPDQPKPFDPAEMTWEERYVMLLWLSHLMLIPFDLTSVASDEVADGLSSPTIPFAVPAETPRIARHLLSRALCYLSVPGKEREAARALLVRLALRTDMLRLGLHGTIISWSLGVVEHGGGDPPPAQHESIGALSFLVGFVKSADDGIMRQLLAPIWECMQSTFEQPSLRIDAILSSAVVRKSTIKIYCLLGVVAKRLLLDGSQAMLGDVAARLVDGLDDKETPVRLAASKASSMISSHVGEEMTSYIVDALLEGLEQDFRYSSTEHGERRPIADSRFVPASDVQPDYTSVDALGWHGYILTMAHLLFRRAIPAARLVDITGWLYLALDFDQRSTLGASIGTNVRDAACFGLWSLSRKYTSGEILGRARDASGESAASSLQKTAGKLVEAACLDPSGNIRRGSSAALQELVGRHPDQVAAGLALVQCVDYHAVASVQGAMLVGIEAARSDVVYEHVLFHGLLGWRGLRSTDAATRRLSAETIGRLVTTTRSLSFNDAIGTLEDRLGQTRVTDVEHRHGIITALARIVQSLHGTNHAEDTSPADEFGCLRTDESATPIPVTTPRPDAMRNWALVLGLHRGSTLTKHDRDAAERSQYTHEARSHFIWALASAIRCKHAIPDARPVASAFDPLMSDETLVRMSLARQESLVVMYTSRAMVGFLALMPVVERRQLLRAMITMVRSSEPRFQGLRKVGSIRAVGLATVVFRDLAAEHGRITADVHSIIDSLLEQTSAGNEIEVRCAALESLVRGPFFYCQEIPQEVVSALQVCLDDYTIDHRGDVGSLVRIAAIDAAALALRRGLVRSDPARKRIVARVAALAAEKLDKVRYHAARCLQASWTALDLSTYTPIAAADVHETTTTAYFSRILALHGHGAIGSTMLEGFVSTAGDGSASVLHASREALAVYAESMPPPSLCHLCTHLVQIVRESRDARVSIWAMEVIAFLFDAQIIQRLVGVDFSWRALLSVVRLAHFQSTDIRRLEAAIAVYWGLASIADVRIDALKKLCDMLRNPIAKIRNTAAETLFSILPDEEMLATNWSRSSGELKRERERIKARVDAMA